VLPPLFRAFGPPFLLAVLLKLSQDILKFVSPQILKQLVIFVQQDPEDADAALPNWAGYVLACCLFAVSIVQSIVLQQYWQRTYQVILHTNWRIASTQ
jgi:ATP-binding cassette subfamily C (CFTR/MRP) protein 1